MVQFGRVAPHPTRHAIGPTRTIPHATQLVSPPTIGSGFAFMFGMIATRLKLSPLAGDLLAGAVESAQLI